MGRLLLPLVARARTLSAAAAPTPNCVTGRLPGRDVIEGRFSLAVRGRGTFRNTPGIHNARRTYCPSAVESGPTLPATSLPVAWSCERQRRPRTRREGRARVTPDGILAMARGFQATRVLLSAVELDLFGHLAGGPLTAPQVAERAGTDARATELLLNALVALGLLGKQGQGFANTPAAGEALVPDAPGSVVPAVQHANRLWDHWSTLSEVLRTGEPADVPERFPDATEVFILAMHVFARQRAAAVVELVDLRGVRRLLDLGGGPGTYACAFARRRPGLEVVLFDRPPVVPIAQRVTASECPGGQIRTVPGDFLSDHLGSGFDLIWASAIIHMLRPEQNRMLFTRCYAALSPGGRLVIQDGIMDESKTHPPDAALFAINMLINTEGGASWSEPEVREWLTGCGFVGVERTDTPTGSALMSGRKA